VGVTREAAGGHPCSEDGPVEHDRAGRPRVVVNARRRVLLVPLHRNVLTLTPLKATWTCRTLGRYRLDARTTRVLRREATFTAVVAVEPPSCRQRRLSTQDVGQMWQKFSTGAAPMAWI